MGQTSGINIVVLGRIGAPFGVVGWVHLHSYADPSENILSYPLWQIRRAPTEPWQQIRVLKARAHGKHFVALLEGCGDRDQAQRYTNAEVGVHRSELPELDADSHYWADLVGLTVVNEEGICLGKVDSLFATGANDVLVVQGDTKEHLIPYVPGEYILSIEKETQLITVHWDPEF